jgi:hypothetical protein
VEILPGGSAAQIAVERRPKIVAKASGLTAFVISRI